MFLTKDDNVLVNEIAPRVHNSGHHTIEAYSASQFEQHIRAITGLPLSKPKMKSKASVMINILGQRNGKAKYSGGKKIKGMVGVGVHIYGKMETRKERKMGHITALGKTTKEAENKAKRVHKYISI
jgi:5-(carboxyamino)imidazole ribonucleotide synthase